VKVWGEFGVIFNYFYLTLRYGGKGDEAMHNANGLGRMQRGNGGRRVGSIGMQKYEGKGCGGAGCLKVDERIRGDWGGEGLVFSTGLT
jgi:hypothetical protein